jgi:hypothetical protein
MDALENEIDSAKYEEIRQYAGMSIEPGPPVIQAELIIRMSVIAHKLTPILLQTWSSQRSKL